MANMTDLSSPALRLPKAPLGLAAAILVAEFMAIGLLFKHGIDFDCRANWGNGACGGASTILAALYCMIAAGGLFAVLRPGLFRDLLADAGHDARPLAVNLAGLVVSLLPALLLNEGGGRAMLLPTFALWSLGMAMILGGILAFIAPRRRWAAFLRDAGLPFGVAVIAGGWPLPLRCSCARSGRSTRSRT